MKAQNSMFLQWIWIHGLIRSMTAQNTDISLFSVTDIAEKGICVNNHLSSTGIFLLSICSFLQRYVKQWHGKTQWWSFKYIYCERFSLKIQSLVHILEKIEQCGSSLPIKDKTLEIMERQIPLYIKIWITVPIYRNVSWLNYPKK